MHVMKLSQLFFLDLGRTPRLVRPLDADWLSCNLTSTALRDQQGTTSIIISFHQLPEIFVLPCCFERVVLALNCAS